MAVLPLLSRDGGEVDEGPQTVQTAMHYIIHEFMAYSLEDFAKREKDQKITKVFFEIYVLKILKIFIKKIVE